MSKPRDLEKIFDTIEYAKWRTLRESEDSRFVTLALPRVLARLPYGAATKPVEEFSYEETGTLEDGKTEKMDHQSYCWMNAAYVCISSSRMTNAFSKYSWCTAIRGIEGGGKIENLPLHAFFMSDDGDLDSACPKQR